MITIAASSITLFTLFDVGVAQNVSGLQSLDDDFLQLCQKPKITKTNAAARKYG